MHWAAEWKPKKIEALRRAQRLEENSLPCCLLSGSHCCAPSTRWMSLSTSAGCSSSLHSIPVGWADGKGAPAVPPVVKGKRALPPTRLRTYAQEKQSPARLEARAEGRERDRGAFVRPGCPTALAGQQFGVGQEHELCAPRPPLGRCRPSAGSCGRVASAVSTVSGESRSIATKSGHWGPLSLWITGALNQRVPGSSPGASTIPLIRSMPRQERSRRIATNARSSFRQVVAQGSTAVSRISPSFFKSFRLAARMAAAMNGATSLENPIGSPRLRRIMRVAPPGASSQA